MDELPLEALRRRLAPRVELAVLFGSVTAGATHPDSDVDIAVWPRPGVSLDALTGDLMSALDTDRVDLADLRRADGTLQQIVATRGRLLWEDAPGRFASFAALAERRWQDERHRLPDRLRAIDLWLERRGLA
jgi:predicted nucleotidyltransferase